MNKPVYLGLSILDLSKTVMYEFLYDYLEPKYGQSVKLCYMDTYNFMVHMKTYGIYKDVAEDAEKRFDTLNYETDRPLDRSLDHRQPKGEKEKVIGLMNQDELGG